MQVHDSEQELTARIRRCDALLRSADRCKSRLAAASASLDLATAVLHSASSASLPAAASIAPHAQPHRSRRWLEEATAEPPQLRPSPFSQVPPAAVAVPQISLATPAAAFVDHAPPEPPIATEKLHPGVVGGSNVSVIRSADGTTASVTIRAEATVTQCGSDTATGECVVAPDDEQSGDEGGIALAFAAAAAEDAAASCSRCRFASCDVINVSEPPADARLCTAPFAQATPP